MNWPVSRVLRLMALRKKGLSFSMIAEELGGGVTRNACIGQYNRNVAKDPELSLQREHRRALKLKEKIKVRKSPRAVMVNGAIYKVIHEEPANRAATPVLAPPAFNPEPISFFKRRAGKECAYPLWDHTATIGKVCGAAIPRGERPITSQEYCDYHSAVCTVKPRRQW